MKIVLATYGSRGDVQPMLALSLALQSEGHEVLLAAPPEKAAWAKQLGCPFYPLGSDVTAFIDDMEKTSVDGREENWDWTKAWNLPFVLVKPYGQKPFPIKFRITLTIFEAL